MVMQSSKSINGTGHCSYEVEGNTYNVFAVTVSTQECCTRFLGDPPV